MKKIPYPDSLNGSDEFLFRPDLQNFHLHIESKLRETIGEREPKKEKVSWDNVKRYWETGNRDTQYSYDEIKKKRKRLEMNT